MIEAAADTQPAWAQGEDDERDVQSAPDFGSGKLGGPDVAAVTASRSDDLADLPITISRFRNAHDNVPMQEDMTWGDLVEHLSHHVVRVSKDGPGFSPVSYRRGATRSTVGVEQIFCAVADVDSGISPEQFLEQFPPDLEVLLVSTYRSTPEHPKFRAITPLVAPCAASDWTRGWDSLQENVWHGASDEHTKDAGRFYYLASHAPEGTPFVMHRPGKALDLAGLPHASERPRDERGAGDSSDWGERLDLEPYLEAIPEGQRNDGIFRLACSLRARGVEHEVAKLAIIGAASKCEVGNDPFPEEEALAILDRVWAKYDAPPPSVDDRALVEEGNEGVAGGSSRDEPTSSSMCPSLTTSPTSTGSSLASWRLGW